MRRTIGPAGGLVSSHDGVLTVVLQPGALSGDVEIVIEPSDEPPAIFGLTYRVRPDIELMVDAEVTYRRVLPSNTDSAAVGVIRRSDYTEQMGYWQPLPRLAVLPEQQSVIASDHELSLYYGLLEDLSAAPVPSGDGDPPVGTTGPSGTTSGVPGSTTDSGSTTGLGSTTGADGTGSTGANDETTTSGESTATGEASSGDGPPPGTTTDAPGATTTGSGGEQSESEAGMESSDDGGPVPACGDGIPVPGELCLVDGTDYPVGLGPIDIGVGNFDADPALDVVTLDLGSLEVGLVPGNGDGTLAAPAGGFAVGAQPQQFEIADFTGDGPLDAIVLDTATDSVGLLQGDGLGGFAPQVLVAAGAGVADLASADFDGNAALDAVVLNAADDTVQIFLGGGGMGLMAGVATGVDADVDIAVATGSLNAVSDAFIDIIGVGPVGYHAWATNGTGDGFIGAVTGAFAAGGTFSELVVGDIDQDGNPDVVALDTATNTMVVGLSTGGPANFNFGLVPPLAVGVDPSDVVLADFDGDGDLEAVVCSAGSDELRVFEWVAGDYVLALTFATGTAPRGVAVADLSGDGVLDVVVANEGGDSVTVVLSDP